MKTDLNGVSQCPKGTENYETFYTMVRRKRTKLIQYDYRSEDGELFTCVKPTLTECRKARDEHFKPVVVVYTPEQFKELGFDGEIAIIAAKNITPIPGIYAGVGDVVVVRVAPPN